MKKITLSLLMSVWAVLSLSAQNLNIAFRSKISFPNTSFANVWGYAAGGREYALVAEPSKGVYIFEVTNPDSPKLIVQLPCPSSEIQTYAHYAYAISPTLGLYIVDLKNLPDPDLLWRQYTGDGEIEGKFQGAHTLHIDLSKGFLYPHGNPLQMANIALDLNDDPFYPKYAGKIPFFQYTHDGYADNDTLYGAHINDGVFSIIDMRNKEKPVLLGTQSTPSQFTHNTWLGPDRKTLFTTDERDGAWLAAYNIADPSNIQFLDKIRTNPGHYPTPHNTEIIGNYAVTAWYSEGVTIVDATRPDNLVEVGRFDTYPESSGPGFIGCWGAYPYLPSGIILASNRNGELWILSPDYRRAAYLEGRVVDAVTGAPLAGATVKFSGFPSVEAELSSPLGTFRAGIAGTGKIDVQISKFGYYSKTVEFNFIPGEVLTAEIPLSPRPAAKVSGLVVQEENNMPLSGAHVLIANDGFRMETKSSPDGAFFFEKVPVGEKYDIIAGAWGWQYKVEKEQFIAPGSHQNLVLALPKGYRDDFIFDYGWTVSGNATSGAWVRTLPGQFPDADFTFSGEIGDQCYLTGIADIPLQQNGVKDGATILASPPIALSSFSHPRVSFVLFFEAYNGGLDGPEESLEFLWDTGDTIKLFVSFHPLNSIWGGYTGPVMGLDPSDDTVRLIVKAFDNPAITNVSYEAAFDWFKMEEGGVSDAASPETDVLLNVMPNPFRQTTRLQYELPGTGYRITVTDIGGRIVLQQNLEAQTGLLELGDTFFPGVYFARLSKDESALRTFKLIKIR